MSRRFSFISKHWERRLHWIGILALVSMGLAIAWNLVGLLGRPRLDSDYLFHLVADLLPILFLIWFFWLEFKRLSELRRDKNSDGPAGANKSK